MAIHKDDFDGYLVFKGASKFNKKTGRDVHQKKRVNLYRRYEKIIKIKKNQKNRSLKDLCPSQKNCGNKNKKFIFKKNGFDFYRCSRCELIYVDPLLKEEIFHSNLVDEDSYTNVMKNKINLSLDKKKFQYGLQKIKNINKSKKVLDIGCGFGFFLDEAKIQGWNLTGAEISSECIKVLKRKKIEILDFEKTNLKEHFDLITLWTVLEHIAKPNDFLKKIKKLLKKNGKLIINVPNANSLTARILKEKCSTFAGEQHLNYYTPNSINKLLNNLKFEVQSLETIISDLGTVKNYLQYENPYLGESKFNSFLIDPKKIHNELMGYIILVIAKKI